MTIGIKVSKPGFDVKSTTDLNLSFSSKYTHPQILKAGRIGGTSDQFIHGLGFPPTTAGYMLTDNKYFVQYDLKPLVFEKFENGDYGTIRTDRNSVYLESEAANNLVYLVFANPAQSLKQLGGGQKVRDSKAGMDLSVEGVSVRQAREHEISLSTHFETFNIIDEKEITVQTISIGPVNTSVKNSVFVDIPHSLGYAAHMILINEFEGGGVGYFPGSVDVGPGACFTNTEVYIDSKKVRIRVSQNANGSTDPLAATCTARNFRFKYYLTNYKLPL